MTVNRMAAALGAARAGGRQPHHFLLSHADRREYDAVTAAQPMVEDITYRGPPTFMGIPLSTSDNPGTPSCLLTTGYDPHPHLEVF